MSVAWLAGSVVGLLLNKQPFIMASLKLYAIFQPKKKINKNSKTLERNVSGVVFFIMKLLIILPATGVIKWELRNNFYLYCQKFVNPLEMIEFRCFSPNGALMSAPSPQWPALWRSRRFGVKNLMFSDFPHIHAVGSRGQDLDSRAGLDFFWHSNAGISKVRSKMSFIRNVYYIWWPPYALIHA